MIKHKEHRFRIDAFTPATLPMERLAEYMTEFAKLLGEAQHVHFVDVGEGSAILRARVEPVAVPKVERRINAVRQGNGDASTIKILKSLDDMLANDNAIGQLLDEAGAEIILFQGRNRPKPLVFGPIRADGVL
jgi:hypothetical protein